MSALYHTFYSLNDQRGHQLFYDQVLQTYPIASGQDFVPGGYLADGTVISYGKNCTVRTTDQYNMPTNCSTWAGAPGPAECCPLGSIPAAQSKQDIPLPFFPVTAQDELAAANGTRL
jgi:hypothetical protein